MKVRLFSYGNFGLLVWNCAMKDRSGRKFGLTSAHYVRLGTFEDRMKTFAPFVRELLLRIAKANPKARFIAGSGRAMWFMWLLILIASVLLIPFMVIGMVQGEMTSFETMKSLPYFAVVLILLPWVWRGIRRDWPREFDPRKPPAGFPR
jgi:hypothetical protein